MEKCFRRTRKFGAHASGIKAMTDADKLPLPTTPQVAVSWGELIDKITILEIKSLRLTREDALANVRKELGLLTEAAGGNLSADGSVSRFKSKLRTVNEALWDIEDKIREKEARQEFDAEFIKLARSVYQRNDERAGIKKEINNLLSSGIVEEKSYKHY